jgi:hypothetical protein
MDSLSRPGNDACATIAGFVFQVNVTIQHWLKLGPGEHLELEAGEDIDIVRQEAGESGADPERLTVQLKQLSGASLTLRNPKSLESVANFCCHRQTYPDWKIKFRFMTTLGIGKEQAWRQTGTAILTWEDIRLEKLQSDNAGPAVEAIRQFLKSCDRPAQYSVRSWNCLESVLDDANSNELLDVIRRFEWVTGAGDHRKVKEEVIETLKGLVPGRSVEAAERTFEHLFASVFARLCMPGQKMLTWENLATALAGTSAIEEDLMAARRLLTRLDVLEGRVSTLETAVKAQGSTIQALVVGLAEGEAKSRKTFYTHAEFFAVFNRRQALYDFDQQLQGRRSVQAGLDQFLNDPEKLIAVLPGRGGIGKTKLLRDWSQKQSGWTSLWTAPRIAQWHNKTESEIPDDATLLIVDDAHRYDFLEQVLDVVVRRGDANGLKLVISIRPSGSDYLKRTLATMMDASVVTHFDPLKPLKAEDLLAMAQEALGQGHMQYAQQLAAVSHDAPIITVAGGRLIAREEVHPKLLNNHEQFCSVVMEHLASQYEGEILTRGVLKRDFMEVVAALQPVTEGNASFYKGVQDYLGLHESQSRRSFGTLEEGGVLIRSGGKASIVPDMLADHILERAATEPDGTPTRFADDIFAMFHKDHLSNLLKNLAELDWRINLRDSGSHLLDEIWATISQRFREQDAPDRFHFLHAIEAVAQYQPERVHAIVQLAMDEEATPAWSYGLYYYTQHKVLRRLPDFLGVTVFHPNVSRDAFDRLWKLAHNEDDEVRRSAQRTLESTIGYHKYKDVRFQERILSFVEELSQEVSTYNYSFTPLDLIDPLLAREMDDQDWVGRSFRVGVRLLDHQYFKPVRERSIAVFVRALYAEDPVVAVRGTKSLGRVISEFRPKMRNEPTHEEQSWQDEERLQALDLLEARLDAGDISLQQTWKIYRILRSVERGTLQTMPIKEQARIVMAKLSRPKYFLLFNLLCTAEWEDRSPDDNFSIVSDQRRALEDEAWAAFNQTCPAPKDRVQVLEELLLLARDVRISVETIGRTLWAQCQDLDFLVELSRRLLVGELPLLEASASVPLRAWRERDRAEFLLLGIACAHATSAELALAITTVVSSEFSFRPPMPEELEILSILSRRKEPLIVLNLFHGIGALARQPQFTEYAESLIREVEIGTHPGPAEGYCGLVGPGPFSVGPHALSLATIHEMLRKLVPVTKLDQHHFGAFISYVCGRTPVGVVGLLEARLEHGSQLSSDHDRRAYKSVPSPQHWSSLSGVRESPDYFESLRRLLGLLRTYLDASVNLEEFFWRVAAGDDTTLLVFSELIASRDETDLRVVLHLLHEGPIQVVFTSPAFAEQILERFAELGPDAEQRAVDALISNTVRLRGSFAAGNGPVQLNSGLKERAQAQLVACPPGSRLAQIYSALAGVEPVIFPGRDEELLDDEAE